VKRLVLPWMALLAAPAAAQAADAPFVWKEKARGYESLQQAVDAIGDGTGTIVVAPGSYRQCAVQEAGRIFYVAAQSGTAVLEGRACEGKAALVLGGSAARVEGLVFANIRVPDRNGAGIRLEKGDLTISESLFRDSENGILSADDPAGAIRIERSTFSGLGGCVEDYGCSHGIYVGGYGRLSVRRSRFERGTGGHYVKSRAPRIEIVDSSFDDTGGRATNYMIDLSNGATGLIARNVFVQGNDKENYSAFVMVAPEGAENDSNGLAVVDNEASLAPGVSRSTAFVADESGAAIRIENNRLATGITRFEKR
jgi:hypothetical protein